MNFVEEVNAFERWLETNYLPANSQLLWYKLFMLNNRAGWGDWLQVDNLRLMSLIQVESKNTFIRAREKLIEAGLISFKKGKKGFPNRYKLHSLSICGSINELQTEPQTEPETELQMEPNVEPQTGHLYKLNETKLNKKDIDVLFESLWSLYPIKKGKGQISDAKKQKLYNVGFEHLSRCIERYKSSKPEWQAFQNGSTFFNSGYVDYLDENYSRSTSDAPKNGDRRDDGRVFLDGKWVQV